MLTEIKLKYFTPIKDVNDSNEIHPLVLPHHIEEKLYGIAKQCYMEGGPAVFKARALWEGIIHHTAFDFQDYCVQTYGTYKQEQESSTYTNKPTKPEMLFELFPNPTPSAFAILTNQSGKLAVYNALGQLVMEQEISIGYNSLSIKASKGIYNVVFTHTDGQINRKLLIHD